MRKFCMLLVFVTSLVTLAFSNSIDYYSTPRPFYVSEIASDGGSVCGPSCITTGSGTITAFSDGAITGTFISHWADFHDWVRIVDLNADHGWTSEWKLENTSPPFTVVTFGTAKAGDLLRIDICDRELQNPMADCPGLASPYFFSSDPHAPGSADAVSHAKFNPTQPMCWGTGDVTPSWFFWLEDLGAAQNTDWDYNDYNFVLGNVLANNTGCPQPSPTGNTFHSEQVPTPEPASFALLGSGFVALLRSRRRKSL